MTKNNRINIAEYLGKNLQSTLCYKYGETNIEDLPLPESLTDSLNPDKHLRPYQKKAIQMYMTYHEKYFSGNSANKHVLFHMATGSGKTLIMAALMIYLYQQGYRNFLFFVSSSNVVEKTRDNFFNSASTKYLFGDSIVIDGRKVEIREVKNFQDSDADSINFRLTTIQGLHTELKRPLENSISYSDFCSDGVVIISDEAHHMNASSKKGGPKNKTKKGNKSIDNISEAWESTAMQILSANNANILLEFTATEDFSDPGIAEKYKDKVIFDYPLKRFREDGYSKEIMLLQTDSDEMDRAIRAVIMSQFKRKLFASVHQEIKPVILFKSKSIKESKLFLQEFIYGINRLTPDRIRKIRNIATGDLHEAFEFFRSKGISDENLILELQEDFKEGNLIIVDSENISPAKQSLLNSLESPDNELRAVFAVNMLNEGWDVLNLFDIVRLYDTRDARDNTPGKTTNAEAQLIGRGARYMPFTVAPAAGTADILPVDMRKFDNRPDHPLRFLETLHYHAAHNPRYITELNSALTLSGLMPSDENVHIEKLKAEFMNSSFYKDGLVWSNDRNISTGNASEGLSEAIRKKEFSVSINGLGSSQQKLGMTDNSSIVSGPILNYHKFNLIDFGLNVLQAALNRFPAFSFEALKRRCPSLDSMHTFMTSPLYLGNISVNVSGGTGQKSGLTQREKLEAVINVLRQIEPLINSIENEYEGSANFSPHRICEVFGTHFFRVPEGSPDKEEGIPILYSHDKSLRLNVAELPWFAYEDNFGTSEEKKFLRFIAARMPAIMKKYDEVFLLRNYKEVKLTDFSNGKSTEPDFILFLQRSGPDGSHRRMQIFIEPKGSHLLATDKWKEDFLKEINSKAISPGCELHGLPFYNSEKESDFASAFDALLNL